MANPAPRPDDENRTLLRAIVVLLAVIAACAVVGAGIWLFSWWQTQRALNDALGGVTEETDLTGTWTRVANDRDDRKVELRITNDNPIEGRITVNFTSIDVTCTATWTESTREFSTIHVDAKVTSGDCIDNEWQLSVSGNTMTASQTWSQSGQSTPDLVLHRESR